MPQYPALVADHLGIGSMGLTFGTVLLAATIGAATGASLGGWIFDVTGNYNPAFICAAISAGISIIPVFIFSLRSLREVQEKLCKTTLGNCNLPLPIPC